MNKLEESTKVAIKLSGHLEDVDQVMFITGFEEGAKWQSERMYSEEEVFNLIMDFHMEKRPGYKTNPVCIGNWFKQFKKK